MFWNSTKALPSLSPFSCTNTSVAQTLEVSFRHENRLDSSCCLNAFWGQKNPAHHFHLFPLKTTFQHIKHISVSHWKNWNTCKWWKKDELNPETYDWKHYIEYTSKRAMLHNEFIRCYFKWAIICWYDLLVLLIDSTLMPGGCSPHDGTPSIFNVMQFFKQCPSLQWRVVLKMINLRQCHSPATFILATVLLFSLSVKIAS